MLCSMSSPDTGRWVLKVTRIRLEPSTYFMSYEPEWAWAVPAVRANRAPMTRAARMRMSERSVHVGLDLGLGEHPVVRLHLVDLAGEELAPDRVPAELQRQF